VWLAKFYRQLFFCGPDRQAMRWQATSEQLLMTFYNAGLSAMSMPTSNSVHRQDSSVALLRDNCPWILAKYVPCDVGIDGNCLFRSVSLALYGTESFCMALRVLCLIEVLLNSGLYDTESRRRSLLKNVAAKGWIGTIK